MDLNLLRILSGRHAGARVPLAPGVLRLGPEEGSDVVVTDWTFAPLDLRVGSEGVTAEWTVADGSGLQRRRLLDRQAAEFDGSVICVGPAEGDWPDDAALLAAVFEPPSQASAASSARLRRRTPLLAGLGACVALALVAALWATYPHQPAPTLEATRALVQRTVDRIAPQRLQVLSEGNALVITGMLDAVGQADAVRAAVEGARGAFAAMPRFSVASQVAESIRNAVGLPNVSLKYMGDGVFRLACEAVLAAAHPHHFLSVHKNGQVAIVETDGNADCHLILRGGKTPNYDAEHVETACRELVAARLHPSLMVDCSHANSRKQHERQVDVARDIAQQIAGGSRRVFGVMVESHLTAGAQKFSPGQDDPASLEYGKSITDACIGWEDSLAVMDLLSQAVTRGRAVLEAAAQRRAERPDAQAPVGLELMAAAAPYRESAAAAPRATVNARGASLQPGAGAIATPLRADPGLQHRSP